MTDVEANAEYRALLRAKEHQASTVDHEELMRELDTLAEQGVRL